MSHWYEVYDNEQVQLITRKQVAGLTAAAAITVALTIAGLALGHTGTFPLPAVLGVLLLTWILAVRFAAGRLSRLRRVVWCVKISDDEIVGYDYARNKISLDWPTVEYVELTDTGLVVAGPARCCFEISHLFAAFSELSHRILHHTDRHHIPVLIDGQPWQNLDVFALYPFLQEGSSPENPGALRA